MLRSRRLALAAAAVLIGLTACGDGNARTSAGDTPAVIRLGGAQGSGGAEVATADRMMMPMQDITYVWTGGDIDLGGTGKAWTLPAGVEVDGARVARLAALLGVEGDVRALPADMGGGWMVGADDYSTSNLTVSSDGMVSWWYNPGPSSAATGGGCVWPSEVMVDPAVDVPADTVVVGSDGSVPGNTGIVPPEPVCEEPQPPANVPDEAAALEKAKQLFADMGYDVGAYEYEVYADDWGANVTAWLLLDGHRSPITLSAGYGAEGALTWASGSLATPQPADDYPLVSIDAAVQRLNDESGQWMAYMGGAARMEAAGDAVTRVAPTPAVGAPEPATDAAIAPPATTGQVGEPVVIDQPVCDPATDCVIEEMPPLEPITISFTDVTLDLTMQWAQDGTIWLLPAYTFTSPDMGQYTVIAVDDSFIALPEPLPMPEPLPAESVPVESTVAPEESVAPDMTLVDQALAADTLVGLTLDEATAAADANGWTVRVSTLDGEPQILTMDLRTDRVNVSVADGVVIAVDSVG